MENWIKIQKRNSRTLPPLVKATVQIFSSRTVLLQSLSSILLAEA